MTSPEESFAIEIVDNDLDALNVKKITSEKVNNEKLLVKADCSVTTKIARTNDWVWTRVQCRNTPRLERQMQFALNF